MGNHLMEKTKNKMILLDLLKYIIRVHPVRFVHSCFTDLDQVAYLRLKTFISKYTNKITTTKSLTKMRLNKQKKPIFKN